jgi:predicted nucleic acid-binding protein
MSGRSFFDTNVLVYTDDRGVPDKRQTAMALVEEHGRAGSGVISLQVLQEYFVNARKLGVSPGDARSKVELFATGFDVAVLEADDVLAAIDIHRAHGFSFWDALILKAASKAGCAVLLTEDLQDGRVFDGVQVSNPFR